jgi:hypothetical protein
MYDNSMIIKKEKVPSLRSGAGIGPEIGGQGI